VFILFLVIRLVNRYDNAEPHDAAGCKDVIEAKAEFSKLTRGWKDYQGNVFCMDYLSDPSEEAAAAKYRNEFRFPMEDDYRIFWQAVYDSLYQADIGKIDQVCDSLEKIRDAHGLGKSAFADAIVTFVQDIDYVFVLWDEGCGTGEYPSTGCLDDVRFGLYSPIEFLGGWIGDCDTRALLLYSILKRFGYHPGIAISREYQHAMLVLRAPSSGDFILHKGAKYYFWETTAKGWPLGAMPPTTSNIHKWHVVMD
jgi:hypothetical protein